MPSNLLFQDEQVQPQVEMMPTIEDETVLNFTPIEEDNSEEEVLDFSKPYKPIYPPEETLTPPDPNMQLPVKAPLEQMQQAGQPTLVNPYEKKQLESIVRHRNREDIEKLNSALVQQTKEVGRTKQAMDIAVAGELANQKKELQEHEKRYAGYMNTIGMSVDKAKRELDTAMYNYSQMHVKPMNIFQDSGKGIMAGLAIAIAGFGQALQAIGRRGVGPNAAMEALDRAIDRDIAIQKMNIEKQGRLVDMKRNSVAYLYKRLGDMRAAEQGARSLLLNQLNLGLKEVESKYKAPITQAQTQLLSSQIQQKLSQSQDEYANMVMETKFKQYGELGKQSIRLKAMQEAANQAAAENLSKVTPNLQPVPGYQVSKEQFKKATNFAAHAKLVDDSYRTAIAYLTNKSLLERQYPQLLDDEKAKANVALNHLRAELKGIWFFSFGSALSSTEMPLFGTLQEIDEIDNALPIMVQSWKNIGGFIDNTLANNNMQFKHRPSRIFPTGKQVGKE